MAGLRACANLRSHQESVSPKRIDDTTPPGVSLLPKWAAIHMENTLSKSSKSAQRRNSASINKRNNEMNPSQDENHQWIQADGADTDMMSRFQGWLDAGLALLWRPIYSRSNFPKAPPEILDILCTHVDLSWAVNEIDDLMTLPAHIKGWIMPVTANDTDIVCSRTGNAIYFMGVKDSRTGAPVTYQDDLNAPACEGSQSSSSQIHATQLPRRRV
jgi:hypothetical protein